MTMEKTFNLLVVDDEKDIHDLFYDVLGNTQSSVKKIGDLGDRLFSDQPAPTSLISDGYKIHCCSQGKDAVDKVRVLAAEGERFAVAFDTDDGNLIFFGRWKVNPANGKFLIVVRGVLLILNA